MNNGVRHGKRLKRRAAALRRAGWTIPGLALDLGIAKSTAHLWVRDVAVSQAHRHSIAKMVSAGQQRGNEAVRRLAGERVAQAIGDAKAEWASFGADPLFLLGIGIYMGEGFKRGCTLGLSNSDEGIVRVWIRWCRTFAGGHQFRADVMVHTDNQREPAMKFWQKVAGDFVVVQAARAYVSSATGKKRPINRLPNGTLRIEMRAGSRLWHAKMMEWIRLAIIGV